MLDGWNVRNKGSRYTVHTEDRAIVLLNFAVKLIENKKQLKARDTYGHSPS